MVATTSAPASNSADAAGVQTYGATSEGSGGYRPMKPLEELSPQQIIDLNDKWYRRCMAGRRHVEKETLLSLAFYLGEQYVEALPYAESSRITAIPKRKGKIRTVDNQIKPIVRSEHARLLKNRPQGTCVPGGYDAEDYESATAADDIIVHTSRECELESYLEDAVLWSLLGGSALINCHWDPFAVTSYGEEGNFLFRSLSVFEFGLPLLRKSRLDDQPYIMVTRRTEIDEIYEQWGVSVPPEKGEMMGSMEERLVSAITYSLGAPFVSTNRESDCPSAVVKETWLAPCRLAPQGAVIISASNNLLDMKPWPKWCNGRFPFGKIEFCRIPGSAYGQGIVWDLIPVQRRHNRALSIAMESMNLMAQIGVAVPKGTSTRKILAGQGTLLEMPPGAMGGVQNIMAPQIGDAPYRELEQTREAFRSIAFQHEATRGQNPPGVRSGTQIELLKEFDDSASVICQRSIERTVQRLGNIVLDIAKNEWDAARLVTVLSVEGDIERRSFLGRDQVQNAGQYVVQSGSAWPTSKAERQNLIMQLATTGGADGQAFISTEEALTLLELGGLRKAINDRDVDERARRENQAFQAWAPQQDPQTGQPVLPPVPTPHDWDNHEVHIQRHGVLRKGPEYAMWSPAKKKLLDAHIGGHVMALRMQMVQVNAEKNSVAPSAQMEAERQRQLDIATEQAKKESPGDVGAGSASETKPAKQSTETAEQPGPSVV